MWLNISCLWFTLPADKEHWEPVLERLLELQKGDGSIPIREAWSFDLMNHGDGAIINEEALANHKSGVCMSYRLFAL